MALIVKMPAAAKHGLVLLVERLAGDDDLAVGAAAIEVAEPATAAVSTETPLPHPQAVPVSLGPINVPRVSPPTAELGQADATFSNSHVGELPSSSADTPQPVATLPQFDGHSLDGRRAGERQRLALARGGTLESEAAVERGLRWLAVHQLRGGSWNFNHDLVCRGACRNTGSAASTTAATGIVLLAFLGAGCSHQDGPYQQTVRDALYYLGNCALATPHGGDLQQGSMYGQGLATLALCEAYAMTRDPALARVAAQALEFVIYAQDSRGGGWRYFPGQPGDTTVTGWQLMALKAGQIAELPVSPGTVAATRRFLDGVQAESGAFYGYQRPARGATTTAVGLLCRMFLGWQREHPALTHGAEWLAETGPAVDDMYFNYYATAVLNHYGGQPWQSWNPRMREQLIATQASSGHESGSWFFAGGQLVTAGRIVNTALAIMTLEVYYRYLPLYGDSALEDAFD
ncbi:MAG: terpene cyclase/mutase family protein [Pirellulales bacterium]|nr:terpene cyclase/mutase family protein [Pirellulales bacterium]